MEAVDFHRVRNDFTQRAARQIRRAAREEEDPLILRPAHSSRTPRPQARQRAEQQRLAGSRSAQDQHPVTGTHDDLLLLQHVAPARGDDLEILDRHRVRLVLRVGNAALVVVQHIRAR